MEVPSNMSTKIKLKRGLEVNLPVLDEGELAYTTDTHKLFIGTAGGNEFVGPYEGFFVATYNQLKAWRDAGQLIPGAKYRMTDYITTTAQSNTQSAEHQFDIIVTADDVDKLNENARAVHSESDTIFKGITASIATGLGEAGDVLKRAFDFDNTSGPPAGFIYAWGTNEDISDGDASNFVFTQSDTPSAGDAVADAGNYGYGTVVSRVEESYFANSKLEAWQLKYCLDNDTSRFAWADEVNGKGVIYRMIDEFNNDCPYDFKNIQFKRKLTDGELDLDSGIDTWVYTFTLSDLIEGKVVDMSLKQNTEYIDDDGEYKQCANNSIKETLLSYHLDGLLRIQLNDNVFLNIFDDLDSYLYNHCRNNTFGNGCYNNTFGNSCHSNTFGTGCYNNTFGNSCHANTFGNYCYSNTFGDYCYSNTFGNSCYFNTFGNDCFSNTFGNSCRYNTFGSSCYSNTFGNYCYSNTFGDYCYSNTFGDSCYFNTFGNDCFSNTFGNDCRYLKINDNTGTEKKYIRVDSGVRGASSANKFDLYDPAILDKDYQVTFKKSASGKYLMLWATDTGAMTGKVKNDNLDNTWEDIV